jgi:hypothetical protein
MRFGEGNSPAPTKVFATANYRPAKPHIDVLRRLVIFLKFLSEMGQQSGNVALMFAARHDRFFAMRKIACVAKRLGRVASLLRCVHLDAVMHNRNAHAGADWNRFWDRTGAS